MSDHLKAPEIQKTNFSYFDIEHLRKFVVGQTVDRPKFVHIGGPSAAGKTTMGLILQSELPEARTLSIDSYLIAGLGKLAGVFSDIPINPNEPYIGGISPKVWDFDLLKSHLAQLRANKAIRVPVFDQTIKDRVGWKDFDPPTQVILEGGHSFSQDLRENADYLLLINASLHDRLVRKAVRTHARYGRDDLNDVWGRYLQKDEPSWKFYESEFRGIADQVFFNPANPLLDYAGLRPARYRRASGVYHKMLPTPSTGTIHPTEELGLVETGRIEYQLSYSAGGRDLVNLPLDKEYVDLLDAHYEISEGETVV